MIAALTPVAAAGKNSVLTPKAFDLDLMLPYVSYHVSLLATGTDRP